MYKHLLICNIFFIFTRGKIIPPINTATKTTIPLVSQQLQKNSSTTENVVGKNGSITLINPVTLPNGEYIALINIDKEVSGNKEKSVVPRKGVNPQDALKSPDDTTTGISNITLMNNTNIPTQGNNITNVMNVTNITQKVNETKVHKPLVVSSEALANMDKMNNIDINESDSSTIVHAIKAGSHPGMIIPIVITILIVPMFAVIGYMALKKGQEAWKNRHYKRMDFLLDGMYND